MVLQAESLQREAAALLPAQHRLLHRACLGYLPGTPARLQAAMAAAHELQGSPAMRQSTEWLLQSLRRSCSTGGPAAGQCETSRAGSNALRDSMRLFLQLESAVASQDSTAAEKALQVSGALLGQAW